MSLCSRAGTDVMIKKNFCQKIQQKLAFLTQSKAKLCKILIMTLLFKKSANYFAENCPKSHKILIITSTPGCPPWKNLCKRVIFIIENHF
jgi:hypothetical protein